MKFGAVLKKSRIQSGLSQDELGDKIFLSRSTVSRLENDKLELKMADGIRWLQATQAHEALVAMLLGVDVTTIVQNISTLLGGFISFLL